MFTLPSLYLKILYSQIEKNILMYACLCITILLLFSTNLYARNWVKGWVYIQNVQTGLVIDVQGNIKKHGISVWPYSLNYSKAQMFRFSEFNIPERFGSDARYILAYDDKSSISDFILSVKKPPMVIAPPHRGTVSDPGIVTPPIVAPPSVVVGDSHNTNKKILRNYLFSVETKQEYAESPFPPVSAVDTKPKQIWKIIPVDNEEDTYYIQSAHFSEKMVIEPLDNSSGGTLVLSSFTGSNLQKWKILKTKPEVATNIKLTNFVWDNDTFLWWGSINIRGKLTWTKNASNLLDQSIIVRPSSGGGQDSLSVGPTKNSSEFEFGSNTTNKTKEHCFSIKSTSKWQAQNWSFSDEVCEHPKYPGSPTPPTTPPAGIGKLLISNCHNDKKQVHLWTYDLTNNNGVYKDHGTLGSQWQGSTCPVGSPKEINISDDHVYVLIAIDCGDNPPNQTQGSCHKLTSSAIQGQKDGSPLIFQIN